MLVISLVGVAVLLTAANLNAYLTKYPGMRMIGLSLVFLFLSASAFPAMALPPVAWLALFLPVALLIWKSTSRGPGLFLGLSLAATVVAFAIPAFVGFRAEQGFAKLRTRYPFESMEERLPLVKVSTREHSFSPATIDRMERQEEGDGRWNRRTRLLERLHEDAVGLFVRNFGFGVGRMIPLVPTEARLSFGCERLSIPQPGPRIPLTGSPGEWGKPPGNSLDRLDRLHDESAETFLEPWTFGYFKDRRHVAGFEPHRFQEVPDSSKSLNVRTLDLVGLILHDEPRVYVSENLPRMDELRAAPTRSLDAFESVALISLQGGADQWIISEGGTIRMLGAIRNTKQCLACHGGERGDLLGAFSYTIAAFEPTPSTK